MKAILKGKLHKALVTTFVDKDTGDSQSWARIQLIQPDNTDVFDQIINVKVSKDNFGYLPDFQLFLGIEVFLNVDISEYRRNNQVQVNYSLDGSFLSANDHLKEEYKKRSQVLSKAS